MRNLDKILTIIGPVIAIAVTLVSLYFFSHRMDIFALFMGVALILNGIRVIIRRKFDPNAEISQPLSQIDEHRMTKQNKWYRFNIPMTFVMVGKEAVMWGVASIIMGVGFLLYGAPFLLTQIW